MIFNNINMKIFAWSKCREVFLEAVFPLIRYVMVKVLNDVEPTIVCSVTWPLKGSEVGGDLVLIQTSRLLCKSSCSFANWLLFTCEKQKGLYHSKVMSSLSCIHRLGNLAHNCKMAYISCFKS